MNWLIMKWQTDQNYSKPNNFKIRVDSLKGRLI